MVNLLIFILACYGASNNMIFGSIFEKWRNFWLRISPSFFGKLFSCFICLPNYWGFIISLCGLSPMESTGMIHDVNVFDLFTIPNIFICVFFDGMIASGSSWVIHTLQEFLERAFTKD